MKKTKVLHLTTHLGGGVGKVLLNFFSESKKNKFFDHEVICLNYVDKYAFNKAKTIGLELKDMMIKERRAVLKKIASADIVVIHWWNHPLLYDFLVREKLPANRLIIWSHVSGFHLPNVFTKKILQYPNLFIFTTPISYEMREVKKLSKKDKERMRVIWSTAGVARFLSIKPKKHSGFNIGYVGTVDYAKLHQNFLDICNKINIPDVRFVICGGPYENKIKEEARKIGISGKMDFVGYVHNVMDYFALFDIFGYPLSPLHYGTCDQALQESMGAGVVPVVLNNNMEKYMIKHKITGIVAKNENDYIDSIKKIYKDKKLRKLMALNARKYASENFSVKKMVNDWEKVFKIVLKMPKTPKIWSIKKNKKIFAKDIFLESIGSHGNIFSNYCKAKSVIERKKILKKIIKLGKIPNWQSEAKGTVHNYNNFLPGDKYLSFWSRIMKGNID